MNPNRTEAALLARGIDSHTAQRLRKRGWNLGRLQSAKDAKLKSLGLSAAAMSTLRELDRPNIPIESLISVLFANRSLCCVCRDPSKAIVVHHIVPWAKSRDHSQANLAVVCTHHHGEAHTRRDLEFTLSASRLKRLKATWEKEVKALDPAAIRTASHLQGEEWYYFNHTRLFELAREIGITFRDVDGFDQAVKEGVADKDGNSRKPAKVSSYMYEGEFGLQRYGYVKGVMHAVLDHVRVTNISDYMDRGVLPCVVVPRDLIFVQGAHVFSRLQPHRPRMAQPVRGVRNANGVQVTFVLDRSEATSMSAWSLWLSGRKSVGSLILVRSLEKSEGKLHIQGTVLGIRSATERLKTRNYEMSLYVSGIPQRRDFEDEYQAIPEG